MLGPEFSGRLFHQQDLAIDGGVHGVSLGVVVVVAVVDAIDRLSSDQLHTLCAALNASRRARIPQWEHFGKGVNCRKLVASPSKSDKLSLPQLTGVRNVQQVYAIHLDRDGARHRDGNHRFNYMPDSRVEIAADVNLIAMLFLRLIKMIIAPLVFATLVGGIAHMGSGSKLGRVFAKTMGWFVSASFISLLLGLVMVNLLQPGANFPGTLPDKAQTTGSAGIGVLDREIPDPSDPDLDCGCDGAERDPADRGVRGVLCRSAWRDAGTLEADHGADRRSRPYHAQGHRLRHAVRAGRGVGGDHGHRVEDGLGVLWKLIVFMGGFYLSLMILWGILVVVGFIVIGPDTAIC